MRVTHELKVTARCPVDGSQDYYDATVTTSRIIKVEEILRAIQLITSQPIFQEDLAAKLAASVGARVRLEGEHSGVRTVVEA